MVTVAGARVQAHSCLFPPVDERQRCDDALTSALRQSIERVASGPVSPVLDMPAFRRELDGFDFQSARAMSALLPWVIDQLEHGVVHLTHPRYFGLFNPCPTFPAECAERIVAAFNPQLASSKTSPVAVEIEAHVIRAVAQRAGFAAGAGGHFTTGGSEANFTALVCALTSASPRFAQDGARAFSGPPAVYVSEDAHQAWHKIAHQAGIGRSALRLVGTDRAGRMDPRALADAIAGDRVDGAVPIMVVATAGTTGAGMIDPLAECGRIAGAAAAWFHVDAAWGGALIASDTLRGELAGMQAADSVTIDAHKWFATTMGCGMVIISRPNILSDAFHASASYMPSNEALLDPYVTTMQWSRRFLGLRLFLSLAAAGWQGYAAHVERAAALTEHLRHMLTGLGWRPANDSPMGVLCVDPPPGYPDAASIARAIVESGQAWVTSTLFRGRAVVRICITNGQTSHEDILALIDLLHGCGPGSDAGFHQGSTGPLRRTVQ